jgi:hypothetical protein
MFQIETPFTGAPAEPLSPAPDGIRIKTAPGLIWDFGMFLYPTRFKSFLRISGAFASIWLGPYRPCWAGFSPTLNCGSQIMTGGTLKAEVSIGDFLGFTKNLEAQAWFGYSEYSNAAYHSYLDSDRPLAVHPEPAGSANLKLMVSMDRTMRLSWSDGANQLPVQYRVYAGSSFGLSDPALLSLMATTADRIFVLSNLNYLQDYQWQIEAFDYLGRATRSELFSFSIAPGVQHFYCAPNPFQGGGLESTTFIFNMPGSGSATFSVYLLPRIELIFSTSIENLQNGVNTFIYNGTDQAGRPLYNGVYLSILDKRGTRNETERFKFLIAR